MIDDPNYTKWLAARPTFSDIINDLSDKIIKEIDCELVADKSISSRTYIAVSSCVAVIARVVACELVNEDRATVEMAITEITFMCEAALRGIFGMET